MTKSGFGSRAPRSERKSEGLRTPATDRPGPGWPVPDWHRRLVAASCLVWLLTVVTRCSGSQRAAREEGKHDAGQRLPRARLPASHPWTMRQRRNLRVGSPYAFTPNGSFGDSVTGRDALKAFAERYHEENGSAPRHWYTALVLAPTDDGAEGRCYALTFNASTRSLMWTGTYKDVLVETAEGWRFSSRQLTIDTPASSE